MSRITSQQTVFFTTTFLVVSLISNVVLFQSNSSKANQLSLKSSEITTLKENLQTKEQQSTLQASKFESVDTQQQELINIVGELRQEISSIDMQYQMSVATSNLTSQKLAQAQEQSQTLSRKLQDQQAKLDAAKKTIQSQQTTLNESNKTIQSLQTAIDETNKTIQNQQRQLRAKSADTDTPNDNLIQEAFATLSPKINSEFGDVSLRLENDGSGIIDIPLELVFSTGTLDFTPSSDKLFEAIAESLISLPENQISIIGHSDARPIVSALGDLYPTNWELSSVRASKVAQQIIDLGVNDKNIMVSGKASNAPIRDASTTDAWKINRRIEIRITK